MNYKTIIKEREARENPVHFAGICHCVGIVLTLVHVYACVLICMYGKYHTVYGKNFGRGKVWQTIQAKAISEENFDK